MARKSFSLFGLVAFLLYCPLFAGTPAYAQTTLADLLKGGTLTIFDKVFSNFRLYNVDVVNADLPITTNIKAIPLDNDPLNPGILWQGGNGVLTLITGPPAQAEAGEWDVDAGGTQTTHFVYDVHTLSGAKLIKDNTLTLEGAGVVNPGEVRINETVSGTNGVLLGGKEVFIQNGSFKTEDHIDFAPQNFITVETIITLDSHATGAAALVGFAQRFSQLEAVPEPSVWALLGAGLVGTGLLRWRRRK